MAHNYPKILAPFSRETNGDKYVSEGKWSKPEFEMLKDIDWLWSVKVDGTSIGLRWDGERVSFVGHTDKSQIPPKLLKYLQDNFGTPEAESIFEDLYGSIPVTVYGEGISSETNQNYGYPDGNFVVFDVKCDLLNGRWWPRDYVQKFYEKFPNSCLKCIENLHGSLEEAVNFVKELKVNNNNILTNKSFGTKRSDQKIFVEQSYDSKVQVEGLVLRPKYELMSSNGERIICKIKCKDFSIE